MFRTRKFNTCPPVPKEFTVPILQDYFEKDGTKCSHVVDVPSNTVGSDLPNTEDYKLSALLRAGVPLDAVPSNVLDVAPTESQASAILDNLSSSNPSNND